MVKTFTKMSKKVYRYECTIKLPELNPVRYCASKEEFIEGVLNEYNEAGAELFEIDRSNICNIDSDEEDDDDDEA